MATNSAFLPFRGPFRGVSVLPSKLLQGGFSPLAINVDTSQGILRCRPGYNVVHQKTNRRILGIHSTNDFDGTVHVVVIYYVPSQTGPWGELECKVIGPNGSEILTVDLSEKPLDIVPGPYEFPCFTDFLGEVYMAFPKGGLLRYDTLKKTVTSVKISTEERNFLTPYFDAIPNGSIVESHNGRMFVAGFSGDFQQSVSQRIPSDQNIISDEIIDESRTSVTLPRNALVFSDLNTASTYSPMSIMAAPKGQKITGMCSTETELLVFTESSVCVVRGYHINSMQISVVSQNVGCVNPRTIVSGQGVVCWMGFDGWYTYSAGRVQKISDDIGDMFRLEGWRETPMRDLGVLASELQYPLCISKSNMWQSCGGYDAARGAFIWSVPMLGYRKWNNYNDNYRSLPAPSNNLTVVFYPATGTWDMWAPMKGSSFYPTCYTSVTQGSKHYLMFGNEYGQCCVWGADTTDKVVKLEQDHGSEVREVEGQVTQHKDENDKSLQWFWMSPRLEPSPDIVSSVRTLRVRQRALGGFDNPAAKPEFFVETERSFDQDDTNSLSTKGDLDGSPSTSAPDGYDEEPNHYWNNGKWQQFKWAGRDVWKARYPVESMIAGHTIRVGFSETINSDSDFMEIHGFDLELQPRRDIT